MIFTAPLVLFGLLALPAIVLLLRLNPPPARRIKFPPLALLRDLPSLRRTPRRIPLWLLLLRLAAAALVILGLAGPALHQPGTLPGTGPVLLVIDNGWAAANDWPARRAAARRIATAAGYAGRGIDILLTARNPNGAALQRTGNLPATDAAQQLDTLEPQPWPSDRRAATAALIGTLPATRIYIADGITDGPGFDSFLHTLAPTRIIATAAPPPLLLSGHLAANHSLTVHAANTPPGSFLLARISDGAVLARAAFSPAGDAIVALPPELANQITELTLDGPGTAGGTFLLDGSARIIRTGLAAGAGNAEAPFLGGLYFIRRALPPNLQITTGDTTALFAAKPSLIILDDTPLNSTLQAAAAAYLRYGGVLVRFAGPITAGAPDNLAPDPLLAGDRRLGGALTWNAPQRLAPFPSDSPFSGLPADPGIVITRQILADPIRLDSATVWASLQDETPLILGAPSGKGYLVSVLTSANTAWSNLALSGLYPALLARLASLASGQALSPTAALPLQLQLKASGALAPASQSLSLSGIDLGTATASPTHPPGLYGNGAATLAFNLGGHVAPPIAVALPNATRLTGAPPPADLGAPLLATALLLLIADLLLGLHRRGLLALRHAILLALLPASIASAQAQSAALQPTLGFIQTGNPAIDKLSLDGLNYLSANVSTRTSASLADPVALNPATDDLSLYPLIYWPVTTDAPPPNHAACRALNSYIHNSGLLIIDTAGSDSGAPGAGAGFAPGATAALGRATACLTLPPLQPLDSGDVLAHCFYILHDFPGRFAGAPTLIATPAARDADGVSPVIIGQNNWAGAWARDADGTAEQLPIPGGEDQRVTADRFGTNLVIYALTGSYKADQYGVPALLETLGQ